MKLSIIVPVFNEEKTVAEIIQRLVTVTLPPSCEREIIVVNDASTDQTGQVLQNISVPIVILKHSHNQGKGAAVISGLQRATGDVVVVQDADLEYDPSDFVSLLVPILAGQADVVFGSRFLGQRTRWVGSFWHRLFNQSLTTISNFFTNLTLSDMETCYKMFTRQVVDEIKDKLVSRRFGIEPEITARVKKYRLYEVPISYNGRRVAEGKKITWRDGVAAVWHIIRFNLWT